jgi:hypothetical protein
VGMLTLTGLLCCVGFINPVGVGVAVGARRQRLVLSIGCA